MSSQANQEGQAVIRQCVPLLDVARGNEPLRLQLLDAITRVLDSGQFVLGPDCQKLERSIADICGTKEAIGCASGSDALLLALMALEVGAGDEVIVPSFTFFATASAVWRLGARPVFVDIDPATFNINPAHLEAAITPATKAIIPVHLYGQCADMDPILETARRRNLAVVEDVAQAIGATYGNRPAGSLGDIGCISFYPTKNLGGFGDGGVLTTSDEGLAERLRLLRGHGMHPRYYHKMIGINSRLDSIQAAAINVKLPHLARWNVQRRENADRYTKLFVSTGLDGKLQLPQSDPRIQHVWNQYTVRVSDPHRDRLRGYLAEQGIGTEVYYPVPLHQQECFRVVVPGHDLLVETERAAREVLSLPIFPELTGEEQRYVVAQIAEFFAEENRTRESVRTAHFS